jgi:hypothetical protein
MQGVQRGQRCGLEQDKQLVCPERERGGGGGQEKRRGNAPGLGLSPRSATSRWVHVPHEARTYERDSMI